MKKEIIKIKTSTTSYIEISKDNKKICLDIYRHGHLIGFVFITPSKIKYVIDALKKVTMKNITKQKRNRRLGKLRLKNKKRIRTIRSYSISGKLHKNKKRLQATIE